MWLEDVSDSDCRSLVEAEKKTTPARPERCWCIDPTGIKEYLENAEKRAKPVRANTHIMLANRYWLSRSQAAHFWPSTRTTRSGGRIYGRSSVTRECTSIR